MFIELDCYTCNKGLSVWYGSNSGAPHSHCYVCEDCKDCKEAEEQEEGEDLCDEG